MGKQVTHQLNTVVVDAGKKRAVDAPLPSPPPLNQEGGRVPKSDGQAIAPGRHDERAGGGRKQGLCIACRLRLMNVNEAIDKVLGDCARLAVASTMLHNIKDEKINHRFNSISHQTGRILPSIHRDGKSSILGFRGSETPQLLDDSSNSAIPRNYLIDFKNFKKKIYCIPPYNTKIYLKKKFKRF